MSDADLGNERVILNVGGHRFETYTATFTTYPTSLLGTMFSARNKHLRCPDERGEYFFDRSSTLFHAILNFYRTGEIAWPPSPAQHRELQREVDFFQLPIDGERDDSLTLGERLFRLSLSRARMEVEPVLNRIKAHIVDLLYEAAEQGKQAQIVQFRSSTSTRSDGDPNEEFYSFVSNLRNRELLLHDLMNENLDVTFSEEFGSVYHSYLFQITFWTRYTRNRNTDMPPTVVGDSPIMVESSEMVEVPLSPNNTVEVNQVDPNPSMVAINTTTTTTTTTGSIIQTINYVPPEDQTLFYTNERQPQSAQQQADDRDDRVLESKDSHPYIPPVGIQLTDSAQDPMTKKEKKKDKKLQEAIEDFEEKKLRKKTKRRRRKRRKVHLEHKKNSLGETIYKGHPSWLLMRTIQTGILNCISKTSYRSIPENSDQFFASLHHVLPVIEGQPGTFSFKDYCPHAFSRLRDLFNIDPQTYIHSICKAWNEVSTPGKSGSIFFFSYDNQYVLKTIPKREAKLLRALLPEYYEGSTVGRELSAEELKKRNPTLKDLDFRRLGIKIHLGPDRKKLFMHQLAEDCKFLVKLNIMDYSLLIGMHKKADLYESQAAQTVAPSSPEDDFLSSSGDDYSDYSSSEDENTGNDLRASHAKTALNTGGSCWKYARAKSEDCYTGTVYEPLSYAYEVDDYIASYNVSSTYDCYYSRKDTTTVVWTPVKEKLLVILWVFFIVIGTVACLTGFWSFFYVPSYLGVPGGKLSGTTYDGQEHWTTEIGFILAAISWIVLLLSSILCLVTTVHQHKSLASK
eukprot:gene16997-20227_t